MLIQWNFKNLTYCVHKKVQNSISKTQTQSRQKNIFIEVIFVITQYINVYIILYKNYNLFKTSGGIE